MAYFSNGSEGESYQARYCDHCRNFRDLNDGRGQGCPIWDAHLLYCHDSLTDGKPNTIAAVLAILIPEDKDGFADECAMYAPEPKAVR